MLSNIKAWRARRLSNTAGATSTPFLPDTHQSAKCSCATVKFREDCQRLVGIDEIFSKIIDRDDSWWDLRNPMMEEQDYPSCSGTQAPILLPNEVILQKFPSKKTMHRLSPWKLQNLKLRCKKCSQNKEVIMKLVMAGTTLGSAYFEAQLMGLGIPKNSPGGLTDMLLHEDIHSCLVGGAALGTLYVTSQRLIFVPMKTTSRGFSLPYKKMTSMKTVETVSDLGRQKNWFFVCYWDLFVTPIRFSTKAQADGFLKMCSNVHFEHTVSQHLPPPYYLRGSVNADSSDEWSHEDNRLPSYIESEEALIRHLQALGFWSNAHSDLRMAASPGSEQAERHNLILSQGECEASLEAVERDPVQQSRDGNVVSNNSVVIYANNSATSDTDSEPASTLNALDVDSTNTNGTNVSTELASGSIADRQSEFFLESSGQPSIAGMIISAAQGAPRSEDLSCRHLNDADGERSVESATQQAPPAVESNATREESAQMNVSSDTTLTSTGSGNFSTSEEARDPSENRLSQRSLLIYKLISAACQPLRDANDDDDPRKQAHVQALLQSLNFAEINKASAHKLLEYLQSRTGSTICSGSLKRDYLFPL